MKTVKSSFKVNGKGLMFAAPVELEIKPSNKKGIRFFIKDDVIEANVNNVVSCEHCVVIANVIKGAPYKIALIEHFMASCAIVGLDALDIYITSLIPEIPQFGKLVEMPIFDGSAKKWIELFNETGFIGLQENIEPLNTPVIFEKNNSTIILAPSENETKITYAVNFKHPDLKNRWVSLNINENLNEIIEARTFGYLSDLEKFQTAGYSKGVTIENTVGLKDDGTYTVELRSEYEPIKHKILDIIGDLYLTGVNPLKLKANILVKEAGHLYHVECAKMLKKTL